MACVDHDHTHCRFVRNCYRALHDGGDDDHNNNNDDNEFVVGHEQLENELGNGSTPECIQCRTTEASTFVDDRDCPSR